MVDRLFLIRHGQTEWSLSGQHTGLTDIPLTQQGEKEAALLGKRLKQYSFTHVFCSPLQRASKTCALAGFSHAEVHKNLVEWNYGEYEGMTSSEITKKNPNWNLFTCGTQNGESIDQISTRADRVLAQLDSIAGDVAIFSHGHFLRVLTARWLQLPAEGGKLFALFPSSLSILGFEKKDAVIILWNDLSHLSN